MDPQEIENRFGNGIIADVFDGAMAAISEGVELPPTTFAIRKGEVVRVIAHPFPSPEAKPTAMKAAGKILKDTDPEGVITVLDCWTGTPEMVEGTDTLANEPAAGNGLMFMVYFPVEDTFAGMVYVIGYGLDDFGQVVWDEKPLINPIGGAIIHWIKEGFYSTAKVGRNEACPCGSGKKFKHCCIN